MSTTGEEGVQIVSETQTEAQMRRKMSQERKRKRAPNWTIAEKRVLLQEFRKHEALLTVPELPKKTKRDAWAAVHSGFVASTGVERSVAELRKKWENVKTDYRLMDAGKKPNNRGK